MTLAKTEVEKSVPPTESLLIDQDMSGRSVFLNVK